MKPPGPSPWVLTDPAAGSVISRMPRLSGTIPPRHLPIPPTATVVWVNLSLGRESTSETLVWDGSAWVTPAPYWLTTDLVSTDTWEITDLPQGDDLILGKYYVTIQFHLSNGFTSDFHTAWIYVE